MNVLAVGAHPDDIELGAGATLARLTDEGHNVYVAVLGTGAMSRCNAKLRDVARLREKAKQSAEILGAKECTVGTLPDNQFDMLPLLSIIKIVEKFVEKYQPEIIFTHHTQDLNVDHRLTHQAVLTATRPKSGCVVKEIYTFEIPSSTDWNFANTFKPNVFFDVTQYLTMKIRALELYDSEIPAYPHPRSIDGIQCNMDRWGSIIGTNVAEAFEAVRIIR